MRIISALVVVIALLGPLAMCGCENSLPPVTVVVVPATSPQQPAPQAVVTFDLTKATTKGDCTWLPIEMYGDPARYVDLILDLREAFKKAHPELEMTNWHIEKQQRAHGTPSYIFGLWIDHRPAAK